MGRAPLLGAGELGSPCQGSTGAAGTSSSASCTPNWNELRDAHTRRGRPANKARDGRAAGGLLATRDKRALESAPRTSHVLMSNPQGSS